MIAPNSYAQILVHLDATAQTARRLSLARSIAQVHGAAVTALYAVTPALPEAAFAVDSGPAAVAAIGEIDIARRDAARAGVDRANAAGGAAVAFAQTQEFPLASSFARQALHADLLIMGQYDAADPSADGVPAGFVQDVVVQSGKAAIVLPHHGGNAETGRTIVIAWKATREAARAVAAAVPLLQRAARVHVVSWGADYEWVEGHRLSVDGHLRLRGIDPVIHREGGGEPANVGELLLSRCCDLGADLLVMGCYGHSRAREWVMGGASRTVMKSMTVPVLVAH